MDAVKLLGSLMKNKTLSSGLGRQLIGGLLGGGQPQQTQSRGGGGGLAELLGGVLGGGGGQQQSSAPNPMAGILGSVLGGGNSGGQTSAASGIAGMLGGILGGGAQPQQQQAPAPQQQQHAHSHAQPAVDQNQAAVLMIRAMVNAAKSDGRIDQAEQQKIVSKLGGDVSPAEVNFLKQEFAAPLDVAGFSKSIPAGMEQQIYAMSLTSIELDTQNEAQYLGQLAKGMRMDPQLCNRIHEHVGAPKIFG